LLVAPKIREYDIAKKPNIDDVSKEQEKNKSKIKINPRKIKLFLCSFTLVSFIMGLALMSLATNVTAKGHELNHIKRELSYLQTTNERLHLEKARLLAPVNIEMIATTELGMTRPQSNDLRMITVGEIATADTLVALHSPYDNSSLGMAGNGYSASPIAAIANVFSGWAITGKH